MSKVYGFLLGADNPQEAQAREVIDTWVSQGYSLRHILTDVLISYEDNGNNAIEWDKVFDQLSEMVRGLENGVIKNKPFGEKSALSSVYVEAIKNVARQGIRKLYQEYV